MREIVASYRSGLTRLDGQPMGRATLLIVLFLDVFILISIFQGLDEHTRQIGRPDERIPQLCREAIIDGSWNPGNSLDKLAQWTTDYEARQHYPPRERAVEPEYAACAALVDAYRAVRDDAGLARALRQLRDLQREMQTLRADLERTKGAYDTRLLENIAGQEAEGADASAIGKTAREKIGRLNDQVRREAALKADIGQHEKVVRFLERATGADETTRIALRDELRRLNFWSPVVRLGMEMLFLLPLLGAFYFWNMRSIAAHRPFQTLVSAHLLAVTCIPVLFKLLKLVYDIIPHRLLERLVEWLQSMKLIALWHYLIMAAAIGGALALVYLFQKKLFSRERLMQRRIAKGLCRDCGLQLPAGSRYCTACGAGQYRSCPHCGEAAFVAGRHCPACGRSLP